MSHEREPSHCLHPGSDLRYTRHPGTLGTHPYGVETCTRCGARRLVEGDHDGPWYPPGQAPRAYRRDDEASSSDSD